MLAANRDQLIANLQAGAQDLRMLELDEGVAPRACQIGRRYGMY